MPSYWSPFGVVGALRGYLEIQETLLAGLCVPADDPGAVAGRWEPGALLEKLACKKADLDLAIRRLPEQQAHAVTCYYIDPGWQSFASVGRLLRWSHQNAQRRVERGVVSICRRLCAWNCEEQALEAFYDRPKRDPDDPAAGKASKKVVRPGAIRAPLGSRYIIDEHILRATVYRNGGRDD
jgi:hypothetical protein